MSYIFDGNKETPETVARRRAIAERLMGRSSGPVATIGQGIGSALGSLGDAFSSRRLKGEADEAEKAGQASANSLYDQLIGGITSGTPITGSAPTMPVQTGAAPQSDMSAYQNAISGIESGGRYDAVGPTSPKLGRALGKYQVMEANVGPWSQAALGRAVTPDEFLKNPELQDKVFNHQFGQYAAKYGPEGAAQAWFAGPGGIGTNRQDSLGTSVPEYTKRFAAAIGGGDQTQMPRGATPTTGQGQAPQQQSAPMGGGMNLQKLIELSNHPFIPPGQKVAIDAMIKQQLEAQDPSRQLDMDYKRVQIDKARQEMASPRTTNMPATIQEYERAATDPKFAEFLRTGKGRDSALMSGDRQAIREAEDGALASQNTIDMLRSAITPGEDGTPALNDRADYGATADAQSWLARNDPTGFFDDKKGEATTELKNVVLGQALNSLKSIFGAAPTEGERKILVDLQASVDKTPAERKAIIERGIQMAQRRLEFNMDRATELRGGTYYRPDGGYKPQGQPSAAAQRGAPISSQDEYNALPSGAEFIAPDGSRRRKP